MTEDKKKEEESSPSIGGDQDELLRDALAIYEKPIRQCLFLKDQILRYYCYLWSPEILMLTALIIILVKLNIISIVYSVMFVKIIKADYYPTKFRSLYPDVKPAEERVNKLLHTQIWVISIGMLFQYVMLLNEQYISNIFGWKDLVV